MGGREAESLSHLCSSGQFYFHILFLSVIDNILVKTLIDCFWGGHCGAIFLFGTVTPGSKFLQTFWPMIVMFLQTMTPLVLLHRNQEKQFQWFWLFGEGCRGVQNFELYNSASKPIKPEDLFPENIFWFSGNFSHLMEASMKKILVMFFLPHHILLLQIHHEIWTLINRGLVDRIQKISDLN